MEGGGEGSRREVGGGEGSRRVAPMQRRLGRLAGKEVEVAAWQRWW